MALISRFIILVGLLLALGLVQTAMAAETTSSTAGGEEEEASLTTTAPASETSEPGSEATSDVESSSVGTSTGTGSSKQEEQQDLPTSSFPSIETDFPDMNENAAPTSVRDPGFVALSLGVVIMCGGMMVLV
ncbi:hypothetical protein N3K66_003075 [Trichothecium roseum]|uniref:Uncharacterized protein n=1 Tax=Trichothecium roseum TaxID=47278 RepID=A0ACC0V4X2_9HYPO|nr:hypothetical protein N3K66_003075 [Trichothecium roseum]